MPPDAEDRRPDRLKQHRVPEYIEGMLRRVVVVVLLGCVGLTAGVAFGTLFSSNQSRAFSSNESRPFSGNGIKASIVPPAVRYGCHQSLRLYSAPGPVTNIGAHTHVSAPTHGERLRHGAPSGRLPMGDYVLFGLLAGLSAAVGFLVPPKSSLTAMR